MPAFLPRELPRHLVLFIYGKTKGRLMLTKAQVKTLSVAVVVSAIVTTGLIYAGNKVQWFKKIVD